MFEYELMNREQLTDYIFKFWENWGAFNHDERDDDEIILEIYNNLGNFKGIEREIDAIREEFDSNTWEEDSLEYENLDRLWNYINWYKTNFKEYDYGTKETSSN